MASVPSAGCLLAKNHYYRSKCWAGEASGLVARAPAGKCWGASQRWVFPPLAGLPELLDKCWWIKSFFHCEASPPTVGRKTLSAG
ncbi:PDPFL protein, partial [Dromaius novaehollandiae]|nr:PDPFL protein [Dromaius novaehollandiae]